MWRRRALGRNAVSGIAFPGSAFPGSAFPGKGSPCGDSIANQRPSSPHGPHPCSGGEPLCPSATAHTSIMLPLVLMSQLFEGTLKPAKVIADSSPLYHKAWDLSPATSLINSGDPFHSPVRLYNPTSESIGGWLIGLANFSTSAKPLTITVSNETKRRHGKASSEQLKATEVLYRVPQSNLEPTRRLVPNGITRVPNTGANTGTSASISTSAGASPGASTGASTSTRYQYSRQAWQ